jgi:signal transduction histidine kinase/CheY-like chemotaxis protein
MEYNILFTIQLLSVVGLTAGSLVLLKGLNNMVRGCLFFYFMVAMFNSGGYLGMMMAKAEGEAVIAQQISYIGRTWTPFAIMLFIFFFCGFEKLLKPAVITIAVIVHFGTYLLVLTSDWQTLYYKNRSFSQDGLFPHLEYDYGVWHWFYNILILLYSVLAFAMLIKKYKIDKSPEKRKGTLFVTGAMIVNLIFFILEILGVGKEYDMVQLGYATAAIFMYIAIIRYDILDTRILAKDFVIERLSDAIVAFDNYGRIAYVNETARKLFPDLPKGSEEVAKLVEIAEKGEIFEFEGRKYRPRKNPLYRNDHIAGCTYIFTDETERINYLNDLEEQKQLADSANKAKSEFLARMSHDIRTPINAVLGMDEMILRESDDKQTLEYAEQIKSAGGTLLVLVNDILDLSKIEEGRMEIVSSSYRIASLVAELSSLIKDRVADKGLAFEAVIDENIPCGLAGDDIRIKQCVMNLLTNAVKYTNTGSIRFEVKCVKKDDRTATLLFSVKDTGIGMKKEDIDRLFEPFVRLDDAKNMRIEGTGLGLSIVYRLLRLMNSELCVKSEYGKGSDFYFVIDQKIEDAKPVGKVTREMLEKTGKHERKRLFTAPEARVLVVDDNAINLMVIKGLLKDTKIQVDTAGSGREAIDLFNKGEYDCMFVDHMMPEMDGMETLAELKKSEKAANTAFIVLTANAITGAREMYLDAGFKDYLSKPVDPKALESMLLKYLPSEKIKHAE